MKITIASILLPIYPPLHSCIKREKEEKKKERKQAGNQEQKKNSSFLPYNCRENHEESKEGGDTMEIRQTRRVEIRAQLFPPFGKVAESFSCMKGKAEAAFMRVDGKVRPFAISKRSM